MELKKVIFRNFKSLREAMINVDGKLLTLVGENESGKTNAIEGISKIDLSNNINWKETTYFTNQYKEEEKPTLRFEFLLSADEHTSLLKTNKSCPRRITIERNNETKEYDFDLVKPELKLINIAEDNYEYIVYIFNSVIDSIIEFKKKEYVIEENSTTTQEDINKNDNIKEVVEEEEEEEFDCADLEEFEKHFSFEKLNKLNVEELLALQNNYSNKIKISYLKEDIIEGDKINNDNNYYFKNKIPSNTFSINNFLKFKEQIKSFLPEIIFFTKSPNFNNSITIEELFVEPTTPEQRSFQNLVKIIGEINIPKEDWKKALSKKGNYESKRHKIDAILLEANQKITDKINKAWNTESDDKINFHLQFRGNRIDLSIGDETNGHYNPSDRSTGFLWYLRFYVDLIAEMLSSNKNKIILIEEPGVYLHPEAQIDLLERVFLDLIPETSQIIYTTHSPFLISNEKLNRSVRVAIKGKKDKGAKFKGVGGGLNSYPIKLLRRKFKYNILDSEIMDRPILVVEGADDKEILQALFEKVLGKENYKKIAIVPAGGAGEVPKIVKLAGAFADNVFVLVDNDEAGKNAIESIKDNKQETKELFTTNDILKNTKTIEDLCPVHLYIEALNDCYDSFAFGNTPFVCLKKNFKLPSKGIVLKNGKHSKTNKLNGILDKVMNLFAEKNYIQISKYKDEYKKEEINNLVSDLIIKRANAGDLNHIETFFNKLILKK